MSKKLEYIVADSDLPASVQTFLKRRAGLSSGEISRAKFVEDGICVNGIRRRVTFRLFSGDCVAVRLPDSHQDAKRVVPEHSRLEILYEDEDLLAVNKPAGISIHPSHGHYRDTLANYAAAYLNTDCGRIRPVGRLDKETSGIVVFAKNRAAAARLSGSIRKQYLALVRGCFEEKQGTIRLPVKKKSEELNRMEVCSESDTGARNAVTHYEVLYEWKDGALVKLSLETGRTHQIRVHMKAEGHPLFGDRIYGRITQEAGFKSSRENDREKLETGEICKRAALHCGRCEIRLPFSDKWIRIEAELPEDMKRLRAALEKNAEEDSCKAVREESDD